MIAGRRTRLGVSNWQFLRWRDELRLLGDVALPDKSKPRDVELTALKRELAEVKKERDFLRDAAAGHLIAARTKTQNIDPFRDIIIQETACKAIEQELMDAIKAGAAP